MIRDVTWDTLIRYLRAINNTSGDIPAFAAVRITGTDADGNFTVDEPDADNETVFFAGPNGILKGQVGVITYDAPMTVSYNTGDGDPDVDDELGSASGDWNLRTGKHGYICISNGVEGRVAVRRRDAARQILEAGQATLSGGSVTVTTVSVLTAGMLVFLSYATSGGTLGDLWSVITPPSTIVIHSSSSLDTSTVNWQVIP